MRGIEQRLGRIEELLGASECICAGGPEIEILIVEDGWDEARIRAEEEKLWGNCPVHGLRQSPVLRLAGSDVHG